MPCHVQVKFLQRRAFCKIISRLTRKISKPEIFFMLYLKIIIDFLISGVATPPITYVPSGENKMLALHFMKRAIFVLILYQQIKSLLTVQMFIRPFAPGVSSQYYSC